MGGLQPLQQGQRGIFVALAAPCHRQKPRDGPRARLSGGRVIGFGEPAFSFGEQPKVGRGNAVRDAGGTGEELVRPFPGALDLVDHVGPTFGRAVDHRFEPRHQML
jgi:hypothetical protein